MKLHNTNIICLSQNEYYIIDQNVYLAFKPKPAGSVLHYACIFFALTYE